MYRRRQGFAILCRVAVAAAYAWVAGGCAALPESAVIKIDPSGRDRVLQALRPSRNGFFFFRPSGLISTALSSSGTYLMEPLKNLHPKAEHGGRNFSLTLTDGTRVQGLFFVHPDAKTGPKPLLMASFGFLQDRWGTEAAKFHELYLENASGRIPAHVLILDHPSAGPFMANNGHLSMGSYDDAKMWIEVAQHIKESVKPSAIHLFGVSMSAQTVVHALIEDNRLGLNLFASGMAVSIAPDFQQAPGKQLAWLKTVEGVENPWRSYFGALPAKGPEDEIQNAALMMLVKNQFVPHYRYVENADKQFQVHPNRFAVFIRKAFEDRIALLRKNTPATWHLEDFSLADLDAFMASTRIARVIGRVRTPLVLVSSLDDPAVEHPMFAEVLKAAEDNPWIAAYETDHGGHFGFDVVYGADYLGRIMQLMMTPRVLDRWTVSCKEASVAASQIRWGLRYDRKHPPS